SGACARFQARQIEPTWAARAARCHEMAWRGCDVSHVDAQSIGWECMTHQPGARLDGATWHAIPSGNRTLFLVHAVSILLDVILFSSRGRVAWCRRSSSRTQLVCAVPAFDEWSAILRGRSVDLRAAREPGPPKTWW
ncbi:MAG TPA: hypothetical protein VHH11_17000, partial [Gammaproteobacteria bacterium]|nr:hypothetical protein [Gammaproteobacteria bacterium]